MFFEVLISDASFFLPTVTYSLFILPSSCCLPIPVLICHTPILSLFNFVLSLPLLSLPIPILLSSTFPLLSPASSFSHLFLPRYQGVNERGNAVYEVRGRLVGDTSLRVSALAGGGASGEGGRPRVESPARPIQVFPALTLHPRNITLVVGAVYQVSTVSPHLYFSYYG